MDHEVLKFVDIFRDQLSLAECEEIINFFESKKSSWIKNEDPGRKDTNIFLNEYASGRDLLDRIGLNLKEGYKVVHEKYHLGGSFEDNFDKTIKIQKSEPGGGFNQWHTEQGNTHHSKSRFMVWMYYLNDCKSGYTEFSHINHYEKPEAGKLLLWPASYTHEHRAAPDLKEDKYIITGWFSCQDIKRS